MSAKTRKDKFILAVFAAWAIIKSFFTAQVIPLFHLDGAFQTASALIRLDHNSIIGKDFFPYLGIGPLIMHWPFFKLFGGSVGAAISASQLLTLILFVVSLALLFHILLRQTPLRSFAIGSLVVMVSWYIMRIIPIPVVGGLFDALQQPGNSFRPIRASLPYIAGWLFIVIRLSGFRRYIQTLLYSLMLGACLLWSNDYALPTAIIFGMGWAFCDYPKASLSSITSYPLQIRKKISYCLVLGFLSRLILVFGGSLASYAVFLCIVTSGHPTEYLRYNFLDIRGDQWWYFSPYESSSRIFNITDIAKVLNKQGILYLLLGFSPLPMLIILFRTNYSIRIFPSLVVFASTGMALLSGGLLSCIGGHFNLGYISYFAFWGLCSSTIALHVIVAKHLHPAFRLSIFSLLFGAVFYEVAKGLTLLKHLYDQPGYAYVSSLGGFIPEKYRQALESIGPYIRQGAGVQEEYFGLTSAYYGSHGDYPVDSLIHLLGGLRKKYASRALPEIVIVTNPSYSPWQAWSMSQNWWFYKKILGSYELFKSLPSIDIYKRKAITLPVAFQQVIDCNWFPSQSNLVFKPDAPTGLYSVSIQYTPMEGRGLLLIENRISIPADAHGYVSLDPRAGASEFPFAKAGLAEATINVRLLGNFQKQRFKIGRCSAIRVASIEDRFLSGSYWKRAAGKAN